MCIRDSLYLRLIQFSLIVSFVKGDRYIIFCEAKNFFNSIKKWKLYVIGYTEELHIPFELLKCNYTSFKQDDATPENKGRGDDSVSPSCKLLFTRTLPSTCCTSLSVTNEGAQYGLHHGCFYDLSLITHLDVYKRQQYIFTPS